MSNTYTSYSPFNPAAYIPGLESLSIKTPEPDNSNVLKTPKYIRTVVPITIQQDLGNIEPIVIEQGTGNGGLIGLNMNVFGGGNASTTEWGLITINCGGA